ncbi:MAG: hypothetical protein GEU26_18900 [Nitrososphaeraceae archaeon]|nr:hypothetical protein [Nitrososphaeraceae archaeon]
MNYRAIAVFGIIAILVATVSSASVFASGYEKSQVISQVNECGNYWFPVNIICSNLNSQIQGDENNVAIATPPPEPETNYGAPFP